MEDCVFCKIVKKETPAKIELETAGFLVFEDKFPDAPVHFLIVPKKHILDITQATDDDWKEIKDIALKIAKDKAVNSFRLVHNVANAAYVKHMHVHFLGGVTVERKV